MGETKSNFDKHKFFDYFIVLLAIAAVALFAIEMFVPLTEHHLILIETIDFYIVLIFVIDLFVQFERHHHHIRPFFKECWIDIIAVLPLGEIFKFAKLGRIAKLVKLEKLMKLEKLAKLEKIAKVEKLSKANKALHAEVALKGIRGMKAKNLSRNKQ